MRVMHCCGRIHGQRKTLIVALGNDFERQKFFHHRQRFDIRNGRSPNRLALRW